MKTVLLAIIALSGALSGMAQDTTTKHESDTLVRQSSDTIRVGGMIIIKSKGPDGKEHTQVTRGERSERRKKKPSNLETNWWIVDLGFANLRDRTNYAAATASNFISPDINKDRLDLKTKSLNVNFWFFMQRLNVIKHVVNLQYGLGVELNNYHFDDEFVRFNKNPTYIFRDSVLIKSSVKKNKLAADYLTVPMMLNFNLTPKRKKGFGFSAGVSAGYLYSSRQKIKYGDNKTKLHDDFDLKKWKLSYIGELNLGPVRLYGTYAMKNMWEKGLDQTPYNVGIRFSNW